jgi:hypothetical protein
VTISGRRLLGAAGRWLAAVKPDLIPALAHRDRPGFLGRGVHAHRVSRRSQLDRNIDRNSELLARFGGARVSVPALYIAGGCDLVVSFPGMHQLIPTCRRPFRSFAGNHAFRMRALNAEATRAQEDNVQ